MNNIDNEESLEAELLLLKERMFVIGELAVSSFDDTIVGIVDQTLGGFKLSQGRYAEVVAECKKGN